MVRAILGIFLLLCGLSTPARALPPSDSPGTSAAAQDAAGTVWALTGDSGQYGALRRWQAGTGTAKAGGWIFEAVPGADKFQPRVLTRGDDGSVYVFWQTYNQDGPTPVPRCLVTVHRGSGSRILAHFSDAVVSDVGFPNAPTISAGAGGDVWLTGDRPLLWHISPDGSVTTFPLKPEWHLGNSPPNPFQSHTFSSLTDGAGRRWFWQSETMYWQPDGLSGVLIWDGRTLDHHPTLLGMPDRSVSTIAPLDKGHFWLATAGVLRGRPPRASDGLYRVDTRTLSAVAETPPVPGAFQNIVQIFQADGDWYVVEQTPWDRDAALWRKRNGKWQKCLGQLEEAAGYYYASDLRHPWLAQPSGVWLGVRGGAWWLPRGGQPALWVNWRRGMFALNINGLFPLASGGILAIGPQGTSAEFPATPQPVHPLPPGVATGGMGASRLLGALLSDPRRHLWGTHISYRESFPLDEWDGRKWRTHPVPKSIKGVNFLYACDALGRLWLTTSNWNPPAQPQPVEGRAVYDPARDTWTDYTTVQDALQAAALLPGMAFLPYRNTYQPPVFSGDGRVTYASGTTIFLYDGHAWNHWQSGDILRDHGGNQPARLHFNQDGHLELTLDIQICQWTPESGWKRIGEQKPQNYENPVPPNGPHELGGVPTVDSLGAKWFVWQDAVYTAWDGLWAKQNELSGPGSPFRYGYGIEDVLRDPVGRVFFVTRPAGHFDLVVWSPPPVPKPTLSLVPTADDAVTVRVRTNLGGPHWVQWRLNGGAWSAPQATDKVTLTALPRGDYRVEVQALDRRLQTSTPPAASVFSIRVAPGTQIARWVRALLHGTDDEREAAVVGLVKQPGAALPALTAARPGASEAGRWWLDAATQRIMEQDPGAGSVKP